MQLDDITLMAYADGELDLAEASQVRSAIEADADAAAPLKSIYGQQKYPY